MSAVDLGDHRRLLRSNSADSGAVAAAADLDGQVPSGKGGIRDLLKKLDRGLSGRRLGRMSAEAEAHDGGGGDRSHDALADGAPPEWALLLIGCLLGLATGLCVAAFNKGVSFLVLGLSTFFFNVENCYL